MKPVLWKIILVVIILLFVFFGWKLRMHFCIEKKKVEIREVNLSEEDLVELRSKLDGNILQIQELSDRINNSRLLLIGESHLQKEVMKYFIEILDHLPDKRMVLNLELPFSKQDIVDKYCETGEESYLDSLMNCRECLPCQEILRWCYSNRGRIEKVFAVDETQAQIQFRRRRMCTDTRNRTMARRVYRSYSDYPDARIIFYGGQLHVLKSGRYKFDIKNRTPMGNRLINSDIPKDDISVIMIAGEDDFPLSVVWDEKTGALETQGKFNRLPYTFFYTYPIYRVSYAGELFDFFVNVGKTTKIEKE